MSPTDLALKLRQKFGEALSAPVDFRGEVTLGLSDPEQIANVCAFAKKELGFDYLVDITSVDNYGEDPRFTIVYELYGYGHRSHLRLKATVGEEQGELPT